MGKVIEFEQLVLERDLKREKELKEQAKLLSEKNDDKRGFFKDAFSKKGESGTIETTYSYISFNADNSYEEVRKPASFRLSQPSVEAIYRNKSDGSQIKIKSDKVIIDNTPDNLKAALDIAEDKGWKSIRIKGGKKSTQAELWYQANLRGFETTGYEPTQEDQKRLLGAKEREKLKADDKALDIKPQQENNDGPSKNNTIKEKELSQDDVFVRARNEIMSEVQKVMPLNEQERHELENTIDQQLAYASQKGKVNVKGATDTIRKSLPLARQELSKAANEERTKALSENKVLNTDQTRAKPAKPKEQAKAKPKEPVRAKSKERER